MKKGTIIKRTDYVATMLAIPVGEEHEFTLTGRDYASYMNAVPFQQKRQGKIRGPNRFGIHHRN